MLHTLDFDITTSSPFRFLERYTKVGGLDTFIVNLARYLMELSLVNYKMVKYSSSNLAASAVYLAQKMSKAPVPWSDLLAHHS